jgi:gamma-glutamyltranspeptidase/glutathione hydrolase
VRRMRWVVAVGAVATLLAAPVAAGQEKRPTAVGVNGAAASVDPLATQAAIDVLRRGGNAFDAAIAAASVLGVVEPYSCGIGGGGFMTLRDGRTGRITTIDSREVSPQAMQPNSFFIDGQPPTDEQFPINRYSGLSVGVPGTPAAWEYVLRRWGTYSLAKALSYGERVARQGFVVDETFFDQTTPNVPYFDDVPSTAAIYLDSDGTPRDIGTVITNPDLAATYERLGRLGVREGFYTGELADAIVQAADHPPLGGPKVDHTWRPGLMTAQDMANYQVVKRRPTHIDYLGTDLYGMAPPSSGGTTSLQALNILQHTQSTDRTNTLFHYLESSRLAYADRNAYLGDPAFVDNPVRGLLSDEYAEEQAGRIGATAPNPPVVAPGNPPGHAPAGSSASVDKVGSTTHLSVADRWGNIVAYTFTIEQTGGSGIVVPGYGFLLNNELTDFDTASLTAPNRADGGKRPRSSIAPTIALRHGRPFLTVGSPGGASIITTVTQILMNRLQLGMSLPKALAAPRASQRNSATTEAEPAFQNSPEGVALRTQYGEAYRDPAGDEIGAATGIEFLHHKVFQAVAEPVRRGGGSAMVVGPVRGGHDHGHHGHHGHGHDGHHGHGHDHGGRHGHGHHHHGPGHHHH